MIFKLYVPGFPQGFPGDTWNVSSMADLMACPQVAAAVRAPRFHRLSLDLEGKPSLMAEYNHGGHWVVLGYFRQPLLEIGLPRFIFRAVSYAA